MNGFAKLTSSTILGYEDAKSTADLLLRQTEHRPTIAVICGSGLGGMVKILSDTDVFEFRDIPHFPISTVQGHAGRLVFGTLQGKSVVVMQGRVHMYEGHSAKKVDDMILCDGNCGLGAYGMDSVHNREPERSRVTFPVRVLKLLGVNTLVLTNAAGAINRTYNVGDLMVISDHINLVGMAGLNPLVGHNDTRFGPRFPAMTKVYDKELRRKALKLAGDLGMADYVREGVYSFQCGPFFETVSECRMLNVMGADVTGMSTVPEVLVARHCGMRVFGVSLVTNRCVMELDSEDEPNHEEVLLEGEKRSVDMQRLISHLIDEIV